VRLGEESASGATQMRDLIAGAFLHDVGKIGISDKRSCSSPDRSMTPSSSK
jgi:HD-GYP domain-containing protein (c-di-GMP phosphodiesterase class II)